MISYDLPTVEECREFLAVINRGRAVLGAEPLEHLDFDASDPADGTNCLSAHHLFALIDAYVGSSTVRTNLDQALPLAEALEAEVNEWNELVIPHSIRVVTDPFDKIEYNDDDDLRVALRDRLVEAGCVAS